MFARTLVPALVLVRSLSDDSRVTVGTGPGHGHPRGLRVRAQPDPASDPASLHDDGRPAGGEEILDVICGDKDFWVISSTHNIAHVKPAKEGAATNMNLVTASGAVYSFLLTEKSGAGMPDLKVYVNADPNAPQGKPKYYSAAQVEDLQAELDGGEGAGRRRESARDRDRSPRISSSIRRSCSSSTAPRSTRSRSSSGRSGTTASSPTSRPTRRELPALYEVKDGKPALAELPGA